MSSARIMAGSPGAGASRGKRSARRWLSIRSMARSRSMHRRCGHTSTRSRLSSAIEDWSAGRQPRPSSSWQQRLARSSSRSCSTRDAEHARGCTARRQESATATDCSHSRESRPSARSSTTVARTSPRCSPPRGSHLMQRRARGVPSNSNRGCAAPVVSRTRQRQAFRRSRGTAWKRLGSRASSRPAGRGGGRCTSPRCST